ncbi:unnamed protein product [Lampetra fluviatilis]
MVEVVDAASLRPLQLRSCRVMARVKGLAAEAIVNLDYSNEAERSAEGGEGWDRWLCSQSTGSAESMHNMLRRRMYRDVMLLPAAMLAFSPALLEPWDQPTAATATSLPRAPCGVATMARGPCTELIFVIDRALANGGGAAARNVKKNAGVSSLSAIPSLPTSIPPSVIPSIRTPAPSSHQEAMIVLLKSLPMRCYFNVVSYSSTFQLLFARSRPYSNVSGARVEGATLRVQ